MDQETKVSKFLKWCRKMDIFSSVEARKYGVKHFYARADRTARHWATKDIGILKRIPDDIAITVGLNSKSGARLAWYEVVRD